VAGADLERSDFEDHRRDRMMPADPARGLSQEWWEWRSSWNSGALALSLGGPMERAGRRLGPGHPAEGSIEREEDDDVGDRPAIRKGLLHAEGAAPIARSQAPPAPTSVPHAGMAGFRMNRCAVSLSNGGTEG
jgi:hypothetical protein